MRGIHRKLFNVPPDSFLRRINYATIANDQQTQTPKVCHICGYFLAEVTTDNGWHISACSAAELKHLLRVQSLLEKNGIKQIDLR
jgi:hypothetical protein